MTRLAPLTLAELQAYAHPALAKSVKPVSICPICGKHHSSRTALQACMASTEKPAAQIGDIVAIGEGYKWHDGDKDWVCDNNGYEFHKEKTLRLWFVITAITQYIGNQRHNAGPNGDRQAHQLVYHVQTLGLFNGHEGGHHGWTRPGSHIGWNKPSQPKSPPPASVIEASKAMIGRTFDNLL